MLQNTIYVSDYAFGFGGQIVCVRLNNADLIYVIKEREGCLMPAFSEAVGKNLDRLEQFIPVVARVHGRTHPEFHDVHRLFDKINEKIKEAGSKKPDLDNELNQLREITSNYTVPVDVCESYEAVYSMLAELDEAYRSEM